MGRWQSPVAALSPQSALSEDLPETPATAAPAWTAPAAARDTAPTGERVLRPAFRSRAGSAVDEFFSQLSAADPNPDAPSSLDAAARMSAEEVRGALDRARELPPGPARAMAENALTRRWAQLEPLKALEWIGALSEPVRRHDLKHAALRGWAEAEPMQALVYAEMNPDGFLDSSRFRDVFEGAKAADPEEAMVFLDQLDVTKYRQAAEDVIWTQFGRSPDTVLAKIDSMPEGDLKRLSVDRIVDHWARYDPAAAKAWMDTHTTPGNRLSTEIELGESWARVDPRGATEWFTQLPADQQNPKILDRIVNRWIQYEPSTGVEWLRTQPVSPVLDNPRADRANYLSRRDPVEAMLWVQTISDPKRRASTEEHVAWEWYRRDRTSAVDYVLNQSALSDTSKRRFADRAQKDAQAPPKK